MGASVKDIHFQLNREVQYHQLAYYACRDAVPSVFVNDGTASRVFEVVTVVGASLSGKPVIASMMARKATLTRTRARARSHTHTHTHTHTHND